MKLILLALLWSFEGVFLTSQKIKCPCSAGSCYNKGNSTYYDKVGDTQQFDCLGGYECHVAKQKCGIAYCQPKVICESVCTNIRCGCEETCRLVRAKNPSDGLYYIVPICQANPCDEPSYAYAANFYCELQIVKNTCQVKGEACNVEAVYKNECCKQNRQVPCPEGFCYDKELPCDIGPCPHTHQCREPCQFTACPENQTCNALYFTCAPEQQCCPPPYEICS